MADEKKCTSCGRWTAWGRRQDDRCAHCHALLLVPIAAVQSEPIIGTGLSGPSFHTVRDDDRLMMKGIRRMALVAHVVYAGIMAAFMMLVAALVH